MSKIISLIAPPGGGKGTQARYLSERYGVPILSVSGKIKEVCARDEAFKNQVEGYTKSGKLVPDEIIGAKMKEWLSEPSYEKGVILDGFPRTAAQANMLGEILVAQGKKLDAVVELTFDKPDVLVKRQKQRAIEDEMAGKPVRSDDCDERIIRDRLKTYAQNIKPIYDYYRDSDPGVWKKVNGDADIDTVQRGIVYEIDRFSFRKWMALDP